MMIRVIFHTGNEKYKELYGNSPTGRTHRGQTKNFLQTSVSKKKSYKKLKCTKIFCPCGKTYQDMRSTTTNWLLLYLLITIKKVT